MTEARTELASALSKIHALISSIPTLEQKKASVSEYYQTMQVGYDQYGNRRVPDALVEHANRVNQIIKTECVAAVEAEFRAQISAAIGQIETLRVMLPQLAAKACVELGETARTIAKLAKETVE